MNSHLVVPNEIKQHLSGNAFNALMQMPGKAFRDVSGRKTIQVAFNNANKGVGVGDKSYFIKQHFGVGWAEIFKNLIAFKKPILGAMTEVHAIQKLDAIGILTTPLIAYGQRGCNPATMQSFVMTEDLGDIISLEELFVDWLTFSDAFKHRLMQSVARLASKLHGAGLCHRDFYLCHFVLKKQDINIDDAQINNLHLIDLHRMLKNQPSNGKAVMKDVASFYFSAMQMGLTSADLGLFKQYYLPQNSAFWAKVEVRAQALLTKFNSQKFQQRLQKEKSAIR